MSTSNGEDTARDATNELPNASTSEPPSDDNDDEEQKTMSTTKDPAPCRVRKTTLTLSVVFVWRTDQRIPQNLYA